MDTMLYQFLSNRQMTLINMVIGAVLFVLLLIVFFSRTSRDERGRKMALHEFRLENKITTQKHEHTLY